MTTELKRRQSSSEDMISNLPQDAIESILKWLSLRDAARTSILSQSWRNKWRRLPHLKFDCEMFKGTTMSHEKLLIALFEVASHHHGNTENFVLSLPGLRSCPQIGHVISLVSKSSGFKDFTLRIWEGEERYKLPSSCYSWAKLNRLRLDRCVIEPPLGFKGFNKLVSMYMNGCSISPEVLSGLISNSPQLEELTVGISIPIESPIDISAPNLKNLSFYGRFGSIFFKFTPLLAKCHLSKYPGTAAVEGSYSNIFSSIHNLIAIKELTLNYYYIGENSGLTRKVTTTLENLRVLTLRGINFCQLPEVFGILSLVRSSPNLGEFKAYVSAARSKDGNWDDVMQLFEVQEWWEMKLSSLRVVSVIDVSGTPPELTFIRLLLAISPKLETMNLKPDKGLAPEKRLEILTEVISFVRQSPVAKILVT